MNRTEAETNRNIFPVVDTVDEWEDGELLDTPDDAFVNYAGIDEDEDVWTEMDKYASKNFVATFSTLKETVDFLDGEQPVLSRLGLIVKTRAGKTKKRTILDSKQSRVKHASSKSERIVLPRVRDVINAALHLSSICDYSESVSFLVLGFTEAFWKIPLAPSER